MDDLLTTEFGAGDPSVLQVAGEIDVSTVDQLGVALEDALSRDRKTVIDMERVTFCDATGLRMVLQTAATLNGSGPLRLLHAARITRLLELVGLSELSTIETVDGIER